MGAFIAKQPNGLYCRFSTVVDCPTNWNMTKEQYIEMKMIEAEIEAIETIERHLYPFEKVIDDYVPNNNMTDEEWKMFLRDVGYKEEKTE